MAAFKELGDHSVVVFVDSKKHESNQLNPLVHGKLHDPLQRELLQGAEPAQVKKFFQEHPRHPMAGALDAN